MFNKIADYLISLPRSSKRAIVICYDIMACLLTVWVSFCLRYDAFIFIDKPIIISAAISVAVFLPTFIFGGVYKAILRFSGWNSAKIIIKAILTYVFCYGAILAILKFDGVPRSVAVIQPMLLFIVIGFSRIISKLILGQSSILIVKKRTALTALIYGAGSAGRQLAAALRQENEILPIGFIDDDSQFWNNSINGLVVHAPSSLEQLLRSSIGITDVFIAMPSISRDRLKEIIRNLSDYPIHIRILSHITKSYNSQISPDDFHEVVIDDVLGREQIESNSELMQKIIKEKSVIVTGAGGSIGSELCRQILNLQPKKLILFDISEFALYSIDSELKELRLTNVEIIPILGSVTDMKKLDYAIRKYNIQTFLHAAAYKHVPMIEENCAAGVYNNVFGTLRAVESACNAGVETFVLISTDKAVRPTSIMGCSKRLAEIILQSKVAKNISQDNNHTKLTMVRFGNVLGSSGSVIPNFTNKILKRMPITVTHPEITRFFMTIPEAAQLVLQAGSLGKGGDVMLLDMGTPVKILDLAKKMINLSGLSIKDANNPQGDIEIVFTGLRPGEKLYEELLIDGYALPTEHPRIFRAEEKYIEHENLIPLLQHLMVAIEEENSELIVHLLKIAVPEFDRNIQSPIAH